jgi:hypothetical protein
VWRGAWRLGSKGEWRKEEGREGRREEKEMKGWKEVGEEMCGWLSWRGRRVWAWEHEVSG